MRPRCVRCRQRPGTVLVHNVCAGSGDSPCGQGPVAIPIYACEKCARAIEKESAARATAGGKA